MNNSTWWNNHLRSIDHFRSMIILNNRSKVRNVNPPSPLGSRAEWKTQKLEFSKSPSRFRTASQHWLQNNWRNYYRMNILVLNQENSFYRERKLQHSPISSNFLMNGIFVNKVTVSAVTSFRIIWNRSKCSPWGLLGTHRGSRRVHLT